MFFVTSSCHLKVWWTKRKLHRSCFSKWRQNIATLDQTLFATYLKISLSLLVEIFVHLIKYNSPAAAYTETVSLSTDFLACVVVPGYWVYSTNKDFMELWSTANICTTSVRTPPKVFIFPIMKFRGRVRGRFYYGINIRSPRHLQQHLQKEWRKKKKRKKIFVQQRFQQTNDFDGKFFYGI